MEHHGFSIIRKKANLYWICGNGYMIASAKSIKSAKLYIETLRYNE